MEKLRNKIALITGGNSGLGKAIATRFKEEGASLIITGRDPATLEQTNQELGGETLTLQAEVNELTDLDRVMEKVKSDFGRIDILVVNAGGALITPVDAVTEDYFDMEVGRNFKGAFFTAQKALELIPEGGSILFISSIANTKGFAGMAVYGAAKAAVRALSRTFAAELASKGIRVNTLSPGTFITPAFDRLGLSEEQLEGAKETFKQIIPLGRTGDPKELANAALFLASDESTFMTGSEMVVDGGASQI